MVLVMEVAVLQYGECGRSVCEYIGEYGECGCHCYRLRFNKCCRHCVGFGGLPTGVGGEGVGDVGVGRVVATRETRLLHSAIPCITFPCCATDACYVMMIKTYPGQ